MEKSAYIFDLYETLIDIRTDENSPLFWRGMAQLYSRCGALYSPSGLRQAYGRMVHEEEARLQESSGLRFPEIDLSVVFRRLLLAAPGSAALKKSTAAASVQIAAENVEPGAAPGARKDLEKLAGDPQCMAMVASSFRSMSMRRFRLYPGTLQTLKELKRRGRKVFLLSNAQSLFTRPELEMTGLMECFNAVYISSEKGMKKPQPDFMKLLLSEQGLSPEECMMVGNDTESDVRVALASGVTGCLLNTYHMDDAEIGNRFDRLSQEYPGGEAVCIRSGRIRDLLTL